MGAWDETVLGEYEITGHYDSPRWGEKIGGLEFEEDNENRAIFLFSKYLVNPIISKIAR